MRTAFASVVALFTVLALAPSAHALEPASNVRSAKWGVGLGGGNTVSGVSAKFNLGSGTALQLVAGGAGYSNADFGSTALGVNLDFLLERPTITTFDGAFDLNWEAGVGGWTWIGDPFWFGVNGVLGLQFDLIPIPLDIVLEYRPAIRVIPDVGVQVVDFGAHVRFYFN